MPQWSWVEFFNSLSSGIATGLVLAFILTVISYLNQEAIGKYIRQLFHTAINLELHFKRFGKIIDIKIIEGRFTQTYFQLEIKNKSGTAINLEDGYLHLLFDPSSSGFSVQPSSDTRENGFLHIKIPLKKLIPRGTFDLEHYIASNYYFSTNLNQLNASGAQDCFIYYYFQTVSAFFPEKIKFNGDDTVVLHSCEKLTVRFIA